MAGFSMDDYVDVAQRIHNFYERYPDGCLTSVDAPVVMEAAGKAFVVVHARAYRTPDDPNPGDGWAWEPVPGPTQFTKDSELMNAQTAAWGRAIVALGFETKKIASRQEVQARQGDAAGNGTSEPAGKLPTKQDETALTALIDAKGGDVDAAAAAMETARSTVNYAEWFAFQKRHWESQPVPFKAPAGVS